MGNFDKALDEDYQNQPVMPAIPPARVVTLWDIGPQLPSPAPTQPEITATPGAWRDYEEDVAHHVAAVIKFRREKAEHEQRYGPGAIEMQADPASAREMIARGKGQYVLDLPRGIKPGSHCGANRIVLPRRPGD